MMNAWKILPAAAMIALGGCTVETNPEIASQQGGGSTRDYEAPAGGGMVVDTSAASRQQQRYGGNYNPQGDEQQSRKGNTVEGAEFANYVVGTDPQHKFIKDAFVRDNQTLGVIVSPNMTKGQVDQALGSLLRGMQQRFTKYPLQVVAYYESGDELARTVYDGRNTNTTWKN